MPKNILIVDDEALILKALKRLFKQTDYKIFISSNGYEALNILNTETIDMMITDLRMPDMNGYELLTKVKATYPNVIRIGLSGYVDEKTIMELFQKNLVKMCIYKPWDNEVLLKNVEQVFELNNILSGSGILQIIKSIDELPHLNNIYNELCTLIDANADINAIEKLLMTDQTIVAKLLRIVNSAFINVKTGSLKRAITYIGLSYTKAIVLAASLPDKMHHSGTLANLSEQFYKHSLITNKICNYIYNKYLRKEIPSESSCIGLLHGVGRTILINNFPKEYMKIAEILNTEKGLISKIEKEIIGIDHGEMSGYLLNWWGLPYNIVEAILFHSKPLEDNVINKELASVIHISDYYALKLLGFASEEEIDVKIFEFLNINIEDLEKALIGQILDKDLLDI